MVLYNLSPNVAKFGQGLEKFLIAFIVRQVVFIFFWRMLFRFLLSSRLFPAARDFLYISGLRSAQCRGPSILSFSVQGLRFSIDKTSLALRWIFLLVLMAVKSATTSAFGANCSIVGISAFQQEDLKLYTPGKILPEGGQPDNQLFNTNIFMGAVCFPEGLPVAGV